MSEVFQDSPCIFRAYVLERHYGQELGEHFLSDRVSPGILARVQYKVHYKLRCTAVEDITIGRAYEPLMPFMACSAFGVEDLCPFGKQVGIKFRCKFNRFFDRAETMLQFPFGKFGLSVTV